MLSQQYAHAGITVLLYDFSTMNENFLLEVMFNLKTFSQVLATVIKTF